MHIFQNKVVNRTRNDVMSGLMTLGSSHAGSLLRGTRGLRAIRTN